VRIECKPGLLAELRAAALEGMHRFPHGGVEIGGVLFGAVCAGAVRVETAQPVECSYSLGPSFTLDAAGEAQFRASMCRHPGLAVVGWYHSHTRSGLELSGRDADLHRAYFKEPWQVALVIRPGVPGLEGCAAYHALNNGFERAEIVELARAGTRAAASPAPTAAEPILPRPAAIAEPGSAAFARMEAVSRPAAAPWPSLPPLSTRAAAAFASTPRQPAPASLHGGASAAPTSDGHRMKPRARALEPAARPPLAPDAIPAAADSGLSRPPVRSPFAPGTSSPAVWLSAGVAVIVLLAAAAAVVLFPRPQHSVLALNASERGGELRITWDRRAAAVQSAARGTLEINGGGSTFSIALDPERLRAGGITCERRGGDVEIRMTVEGPLPAHETVRVLGRAEQPAAPVSAVAELPPAPPGVRRPARPQQLLPASNRSLDATARHPEPPPLRWRPFAGVPQAGRMPAILAEPPHVASSLHTAALAAIPIAGLPVPPPANPPPPPKPAYTGPRAGRLLWIGRLDRGMQVSISGNRASAGVLEGELPGVPVSVTVRPARISRGRLTVYTNTAAEARAPVERPSSETAWYPLGYEWNAGRRADVALAAAPSAENGWKNLTLRGDGGVVPVVVVYWRVLDGN